MSSLMKSLGIDRWSEAERAQLLEELLDSFGEDPKAPKLSDSLRHELDRRLAWHDANPDAGSPWEEVKARILVRIKP